MRRYFLLVSVVSSALVVAATAAADPPPAGSASAAPAGAPATGTATADAPKPAAAVVPLTRGAKGVYSAKIMKGHAAYVARDFPGAVAAYREAIKDDANDPFAHYFLGEAQLASGNVAEADASFASGLRVVAAKDDLHAKLLFVVADLRERQGKWADAKRAWDEYAQFLTSHPNAKGYAATVAERNKVIDTHVDLETKYAAVKQRIEQRLKETTAPPPDDGPQGPTKKK